MKSTKSTKRLVFYILAAVIILVLLRIFAGIELAQRYTLPILMYHKIENSDKTKTDVVSPAFFRKHMKYLKEHGYNVIPLKDFLKAKGNCPNNACLPRKTVILTFDDGYENNYTYAFPVLKEFGYPATIFISPDLIGKEKDGSRFLNWRQLREMRDEGIIDYGSHGMTQAYLPDISYEDQLYEIGRSKILLEKKLGVRIECFSYPVGGFDEKIKEEVKKAGYQCAVTTNRGHDRFNWDNFELNRIRLSDKDNTDTILWAKFNGFYNLFRKLKDPK